MSSGLYFRCLKQKLTPLRPLLFVKQKLLTTILYSLLPYGCRSSHLGTYTGSEGRDQGQMSWDTPKFQAVAGKEPEEESETGQQIRWEKTRKESVRNVSFSKQGVCNYAKD